MHGSVLASMLAPLNCVQVNSFLHKLPERTQLSQERDSFSDGVQNIVNLFLCRETADAESDAAVGALIAVAQSP